MDARTRIILLLDRYGSLLAQTQRDAVRMSYEDDLSLSEIAEQNGVSRQAAHWAVKRGVAQLEHYEEALRGLEQASAWRAGIESAEQQGGAEEMRAALRALVEEMEDRYGI